jgi:dethiobiotin synthetase
MDVRASRHYVTDAMSFLLVLSAVLSAVTGAFGGVRAPETASHQQAQVASAAEAVEQVAALVVRADETAPYALSPHAAPAAGAPPAAMPIETDRLIE